MSTTPARPGAPGNRLPARPRDKRPALALLALLLVLLGALGSALLVYRTANRTEVLVAQETIRQGQSVTAEDFGVIEVAYEEGTQLVPASSLPQFVGANSVTHIPAGSIVSPQMFTPTVLAPAGSQLVGVVVPTVGRPADGFEVNDIVRVYRTAGPGADADAPGTEQVVAAAKIVAATPVSETRDTLHVTLLLPESAAADVITASATGTAALAILPPDTAPVVDWRTE
jgi:hypothetical protein